MQVLPGKLTYDEKVIYPIISPILALALGKRGRVFIDRLRKTFAGTKSALVIG